MFKKILILLTCLGELYSFGAERTYPSNERILRKLFQKIKIEDKTEINIENIAKLGARGSIASMMDLDYYTDMYAYIINFMEILESDDKKNVEENWEKLLKGLDSDDTFGSTAKQCLENFEEVQSPQHSSTFSLSSDQNYPQHINSWNKPSSNEKLLLALWNQIPIYTDDLNPENTARHGARALMEIEIGLGYSGDMRTYIRDIESMREEDKENIEKRIEELLESLSKNESFATKAKDCLKNFKSTRHQNPPTTSRIADKEKAPLIPKLRNPPLTFIGNQQLCEEIQ